MEITGVRESCLALSPRDGLLAVSTVRRDSKTRRYYVEITLREVQTGKLRATWRGQEDYQLGRLAFSPDGKRLVSLSYSLKGIQWNVATGKAERFLSGNLGDTHPFCLVFRSDGKQIGTCSDRGVFVWDADSGKELVRHWRTIRGQPATFSHDLRLLATANYQDVDLWDVRTGKPVRSLLDHRGAVSGLSFSQDGRLLAVSSTRRTDEDESITEVSLWDVQRGRRKWVRSLEQFYCWGVALSPDSALLAAVGQRDQPRRGQVRLFETATGRQLALAQSGDVGWIRSPAFTPDGKILAAVCDDGVRLWNVHWPALKRSPNGRKK
jgi:WD40 repeat protein